MSRLLLDDDPAEDYLLLDDDPAVDYFLFDAEGETTLLGMIVYVVKRRRVRVS